MKNEIAIYNRALSVIGVVLILWAIVNQKLFNADMAECQTEHSYSVCVNSLR